jgi:hypothetical protein
MGINFTLYLLGGGAVDGGEIVKAVSRLSIACVHSKG